MVEKVLEKVTIKDDFGVFGPYIKTNLIYIRN
jgi:hypothetical protein